MKIRISKEYVLLALLIASSVAYLVYKKADRVHYRLPALEPVKQEDITSMTVEKGGGKIVLEKAGTDWVISPAGWKADRVKVDEMREMLSTLVITELVSESGDYGRYQLDEKSRARIRAYAGDRLVRDLTAGKAAPTYNHTYVLLPGDRNIYLARGDLGRLFSAPASEMRDMLVFSITPKEVTSVQIEHRGESRTFKRMERGPDAKGADKAENAATDHSWEDASGDASSTAVLDSVLATLSKVYCGEYLPDDRKAALGSPVTVITITGRSEAKISIFEREGEQVPAVSSQNPSPFVMPDYKQEELDKALAKIFPGRATAKGAQTPRG